ncbi:MAG: VOC family protein [Pseudomonadota bacterium]
MTLLIDRGGTPIDHVAIGVPDTQRGVEEIARRLGFEPVLTEPEPDQFYWSGSLPLGFGRFLEILGPNPAYRGFNPFIEIVKRLDQPRPLFWYVATNDFGAFELASKAAGASVERVQTVKHEIRGVPTDYTRGIIGPGFLSVCPNVIQWRSRYAPLHEGDGPNLLGIELSHPEADRLNLVFKTLGIEQKVIKGPHQIKIQLDTPNGEVEFSGPGLELRGANAIFKIVDLYLRWLLRSRS